jgi:hypothetical protein
MAVLRRPCAGGNEWLNEDQDVVAAAEQIDASSQDGPATLDGPKDFWCISHWGGGRAGWREIGRGRLREMRPPTGR